MLSPNHLFTKQLEHTDAITASMTDCNKNYTWSPGVVMGFAKAMLSETLFTSWNMTSSTYRSSPTPLVQQLNLKKTIQNYVIYKVCRTLQYKISKNDKIDCYYATWWLVWSLHKTGFCRCNQVGREWLIHGNQLIRAAGKRKGGKTVEPKSYSCSTHSPHSPSTKRGCKKSCITTPWWPDKPSSLSELAHT